MSGRGAHSCSNDAAYERQVLTSDIGLFRDKPLALYVFSKSDKTISNVLSRTDSGNTMANDLLMNMTSEFHSFGISETSN